MQKANPHTKNDEEQTPLEYAQSYGYWDGEFGEEPDDPNIHFWIYSFVTKERYDKIAEILKNRTTSNTTNTSS